MLYGPDGQAVSAVDAGTSGAVRGQTVRGPRLFNLRSGLGTERDKDLGTDFYALRMEREFAERMYAMSWAAERIVRIIVDDMMARGRRWTGDDEGAIKAMTEAEHDLSAMDRLANAMIAGRLFGSAMLIVCESGGSTDAWSAPLEPDAVKEGGIANYWVVDRWACSVQTWRTDPTLPKFADPYTYRVNGRIFGSPSPDYATPGVSLGTSAQNFEINSDRMFRFDGLRSPLTEGWTTGPWEREWGISVLTKAVDDLLRDASINAAVGHLMQESSVWVNKVAGFKQSLSGMPDPRSPSVEKIAEEANLLKSIYRIMFLDSEDEADRVNVPFAGIADILDRSEGRLAAIGGIPKTRFCGTSAVGMNATGEGDARDWRITVAAMQKKLLDPVLRRFDQFTARHAGLAEPPPYEWIPLGDMTDMELAELSEARSKTTRETYVAGLVDEDEARERLAQDDWWGELGPWTPSQADQMEMERLEREAQAMEQQPGDEPPNGVPAPPA